MGRSHNGKARSYSPNGWTIAKGHPFSAITSPGWKGPLANSSKNPNVTDYFGENQKLCLKAFQMPSKVLGLPQPGL